MSTSSTLKSAATSSKKSLSPKVIYFFGALGGIVWGYDNGVIAAALLYITPDLGLTPTSQGLVTSSMTIGAAVGALLSGLLAGPLGRKKLIFSTSGIFLIGTLAAAVAPDIQILIIGRVFLGLGVGTVAVSVPVYLSEITPPEFRGRVGSLTQLMVACGILLAYLVNTALSPFSAWRWMFAVAAVPAIVLGVGVLRLPESPRWLILKGHISQARESLEQTLSPDDVESALTEIQKTPKRSRAPWRSLLKHGNRGPIAKVIVMSLIFQLVGINTIVFYAPTLLKTVGFSNGISLISSIGFGVISVIFTIIAMATVDRAGRRPLLMWGALVMGISMFIMAALSWTVGLTVGISGFIALICLAVFKATFSLSWGTVQRVSQTEILPLTVRGAGLGIAEMVNFVGTFAVSLLFPIMIAAGNGIAFAVFGSVGVAATIFVLVALPETRTRTLEEIET